MERRSRRAVTIRMRAPGILLVWVTAGALLLLQSPSGSFAVTSDSAQRYYQQALSLFHQGHYDGAAEALKKAISLQPQYADAHHLLGLVYFEGKKEPIDAIEAMRKAVRINP